LSYTITPSYSLVKTCTEGKCAAKVAKPVKINGNRSEMKGRKNRLKNTKNKKKKRRVCFQNKLQKLEIVDSLWVSETRK